MKKNELLTQFKTARIRLIIGIPVIMFFFTLSSGMMTLSLTDYFSHKEPQVMLSVGLWIVAMAGMALFSGILLAIGITKPLKEMKKKGGEILSSTSLPRKHTEIDELAQVFNQMSFSLNQLIKDRQILDSLPEGMIVIDHSGTIISANKMAKEIFGLDLHGKSYLEALSLHPQNRAFLECVDKALRGEGLQLPQETKLVDVCGEVATLWVSISALKELKGIAISIKDLMELRRIRDHIRRTESLAGLGTLNSILSHEIKNPLGSIRGLLELVNEGLSPDDRRRNYVDRIIQEIDRLTHLSEDLLGLLRVDELDLKDAVNLNDILRQTLYLKHFEFQGRQIALCENYEGNLPRIQADPEKLTQAFENLFMNAFQATPAEGEISVTTNGLPSGLSVRIHNSDSYIPPEDRDSIFLPSYSTKKGGSGFGLFLAQRIILAHNGNIEVESEPQEGTTFHINLPLEK